MINLVCFVEGRSEEEFLKQLLPRLFSRGEVFPRVISFEGKQDLEKQLEKRLRGWRLPDSLFLVMCDQDAGDCRLIKRELLGIARRAGKANDTLVRVACHELESFYLGDLAAVEKGLQLSKIARQQKTAKFRNPDALGNPSEELMKLTRKKYQKLSGSRAITPHLDLENNRSNSFGVLLGGIRNLVGIP